MNKRTLGKGGIAVSALGFGCMGLSFPGAPAKDESIKLLRAAVEQGITLFDTAQAYGDNEELVGETNQALVDLVLSLAKDKDATPAQVALAWLLAQKPWIVPIPGTSKLHRLQENIGGASLSLAPGELDRIHAALDTIKISGDRYPTQMQAKVGK